jgi:hypothetical protein
MPARSAAHSRSFVVVIIRRGRRPDRSAMHQSRSASGASAKYSASAAVLALVELVWSRAEKSAAKRFIARAA